MSDNSFSDLLYLLREDNADAFIAHLQAMQPSARQALLQQLSWHRCFMPFYIKAKAHLANLPAPFAHTLRQRHQYLIGRGLTALSHIQTLHSAFTENNIRFLVFKGLAISQQAYGSPIMRNPKDIDILFHVSDIQRVHHTLISLGYRLHTPAISPLEARFSAYMQRQKDAVYISHNDDIAIEVHWRLDINPITLPTDFDFYWQSAQQITLGDCDIATFSLNDTLCHLTAHGCISMWGRLCWLLDWWYMVRRLDHSQWQQLQQHADSLGLTRMLNISNALIMQLFHFTPPQFVAVNLSKREQKFVDLVTAQLAKNQYPENYLRYYYRLMLKSSLRYKYYYIGNALRMLAAKERNIKQD